MTSEEILAKLKERFGDAVGPLSDAKIDPFITVKADRIISICQFAKDDPALAFDYCEDVTGVDWPARNVIEIVYHLFSLKHRHALILKVETDRAKPSVATVEGVWKAANWLEREVYDMLGVDFVGHSDMRRLLLPDDWVGNPLRKDYKEDGGYHGITNTREDVVAKLTRVVEQKRKEIAAAAPPPPAPAPAPAVPAPAPAPAPTPAQPATFPAAAAQVAPPPAPVAKPATVPPPKPATVPPPIPAAPVAKTDQGKG
jgi:NADH-quinone oxidoreductase subunit C